MSGVATMAAEITKTIRAVKILRNYIIGDFREDSKVE